MSVQITAAEVFSESDVERPCATIARVGGDKYLAQLLAGGQVVGKVERDTFDDAVIAAEEHGVVIDTKPTTADEKITLSRTIKEQAGQIAMLEARIAVLEKEPVTAEAVTK